MEVTNQKKNAVTTTKGAFELYYLQTPLEKNPEN